MLSGFGKREVRWDLRNLTSAHFSERMILTQCSSWELTQKMRLAGAWMTEKYFAATPFTCHKQCLRSIELYSGQLSIVLWHMVEPC